MKETTFIRLLKDDDKVAGLRAAIDLLIKEEKSSRIFNVSPDLFEQVPGSPFAYWVTKKILRLFKTFSTIKDAGYIVQHGASSKDDFRFLRTWWEIEDAKPGNNKCWYPFAKGGKHSPFYSDINLAINWKNDAKELEAALLHKYPYLGNNANWVLHRENFYFQAGLTWPIKNRFTFKPWPLPKGCVFAHVGSAAFFPEERDITPVWALMSSTLFTWLLRVTAGWNFEVGVIQQTPIPALPINAREELDMNVRHSWTLKHGLDTAEETSHAFLLPAVLIMKDHSLADCTASWTDRLAETERALAYVQNKIDDIAFNLYGMGDEDRLAVEQSMDLAIEGQQPDDQTNDEEPDIIQARIVNAALLTTDHMSWLVGVLCGRWDIRIALDPSLAPCLPDPFDPLPVCPPGMLVGTDGLPARPDNIVSEAWLRKRAEGSMQYADGKWTIREDDDSLPTALCLLPTDAAYPLRISWPGILVEDSMQYAEDSMQFHKDDIVVRVREVLYVLYPGKPKDTPASSPLPTAYCPLPTDSSPLPSAFSTLPTDSSPLPTAYCIPPTAYSIEQEACSILGVKSLHDYFRSPSGFFQDHLKRYSKSRRKAPIYWPLSTASGSYTLWIYYHRFTDQTIYLCITDYVNPKLDDTRKDIERLQAEIAKGGTGSQRNMLEKLFDFEQELKDFRDELLRVAKLPYTPNLNDGVMITASPLWKLFRHTSWRKELEECWRKLEAGEYDWAHIAYTMWPERVKEKCKTDKSIAIAHDLEYLYEAKATEPKKPRKSKNKTGGTST